MTSDSFGTKLAVKVTAKWATLDVAEHVFIIKTINYGTYSTCSYFSVVIYENEERERTSIMITKKTLQAAKRIRFASWNSWILRRKSAFSGQQHFGHFLEASNILNLRMEISLEASFQFNR